MLAGRLCDDLGALLSGGLVHETIACRSDGTDRCPAPETCRHCLPRFRTVMQIDGDSYLKVWRAPASQAGYAGVGFDAALERHQTTARHRIDRFGADLQRLGRYIGAAIYIVSAGTPLGGAGTAWLNGEAVLAAALAGATPPLVLFAHRVVRPMLVRAALRWIARRAFRRMNAGTPRDWRSRLA